MIIDQLLNSTSNSTANTAGAGEKSTNSALTRHLQNTAASRLSRRTLLKGLGATGVVTLFPGVAPAKETKGTTETSEAILSDSQASYDQAELNNHSINGLSIEFADSEACYVDGSLIRVSITNNSVNDIELIKLSPGAISVNGYQYDLNTRLSQSPIHVAANGAYHVWLDPQDKVHPMCVASDAQCHAGFILVTTLRGSSTNQSRSTFLAHAVIV